MPAGVFSALSLRNSDELKLKFDAFVVDLDLRRANVLSRVVIDFARAARKGNTTIRQQN